MTKTESYLDVAASMPGQVASLDIVASAEGSSTRGSTWPVTVVGCNQKTRSSPAARCRRNEPVECPRSIDGYARLDTFARFRFSSQGGLPSTVLAADGEVEDMRVRIESPPPSTIKWDQPPVLTQPDNVFYGWNEPSVFGGTSIAADDWYCDTADPVTSIVWWGSFLDWTDVTAPPLPDGFHFAIWNDVPAGVDRPWSHPGQVLWEYSTQDVQYEWSGWDFDPRTESFEATYRFEVDLAPEYWFYQDPAFDSIYWLSIAAQYVNGPPGQHEFGWTTRPRDLNSPAPDDAVRVFDPTIVTAGSSFLAGEPLEWPAGDSWDLAFELNTVVDSVSKWLQQARHQSQDGLDVLDGPSFNRFAMTDP